MSGNLDKILRVPIKKILKKKCHTEKDHTAVRSGGKEISTGLESGKNSKSACRRGKISILGGYGRQEI